MDRDILLLLVGGGISLFSSLLTIVFSKWFDNKGEIKVYCRIVGSASDKNEFGAYKMQNNRNVIRLPMWVDVFNTSNRTRFIRDFNIVACNNYKEIVSFTQIQGTDKIDYGNDQMYSFVVEPHSAKRYKIEVMLNQKDVPTDKQITSLKAKYYSEKDTKITKEIYKFKVNDIWEDQKYEHEKQWIKV